MRRINKEDFTLRADPATGRETWIYTGPRYAPDAAAARMRPWIICAALARLALFFSMGFINSGGMRAWYVILPYVAMFLPAALACAYAFRGRSLTRAEYAAVLRAKKLDIAVLALSAWLFPAEAIYVFAGARPFLPETPFLALNAGMLLLTAASLRMRRAGAWTKRA